MMTNNTPVNNIPTKAPAPANPQRPSAPQKTEPQQPAQDSKAFNENMAQKGIAEGLRNCVDRKGNFSAKLKDFSLGLAAGKGLSEYDAKQEIKSVFKKEYGIEIQQYLDKHREARGLSTSNNQSNGRGR